MDTKGGKLPGVGDDSVLNWTIGFDTYALMCIKLMTNKNLLYKKINKIKFKNYKKKKKMVKTYLLVSHIRNIVIVFQRYHSSGS